MLFLSFFFFLFCNFSRNLFKLEQYSHWGDCHKKKKGIKQNKCSNDERKRERDREGLERKKKNKGKKEALTWYCEHAPRPNAEVSRRSC